MLRRLLLGVTLFAGAAAPAPAAELDAALPKETESVLFVNVRQLLDSDLVKKFALGQIKQTMAGNDELQKLLKDLGLDPLKDIDRVTLGSWGDKDDMKAVGVLRGTFNPEKLFAAAEAEAKKNGEKLAIVSEGDVKLVKYTGDDQPKPVYLTVANETTIVGGNDKKLVVQTLASVKEKAKPAIKKDLAELLLKQDEKATMYAVGLVEAGKIELPPNVGIPGLDTEKLGKQLEKLKNFTMALKLTEDVAVEVNMGMADADAADDFGGTVDGLIGTVKGFLPLVTGQKPEAKDLADEVGKNLKSNVKEKDVAVTLKLTSGAIGKAAGQGE